MFAARNTVWIVTGLAAAALAGCATTSSSLVNSSERLERSSLELHEEAQDENASGDFRRDAQELANEARDFRRVVADRDADDDDIEEAFRDLSRSYHALRDDMERSHDDEMQSEFKDVTEAYLDIEREMGKDHDRLARD